MVGAADDALVWAIALIALLLLPLASWLIAGVGTEISAELDGGRTGSDLRRHLDNRYGGGRAAARDAEIEQLIAARSYLRRRRGEPPLDPAAELARISGAPGAGS